MLGLERKIRQDLSSGSCSGIGFPNSAATFFLHLDDDLRLTQIFGQTRILTAQLLIFFFQWIALRLRPASLGSQRLARGCRWLVRTESALIALFETDSAGLDCGTVETQRIRCKHKGSHRAWSRSGNSREACRPIQAMVA